MSLGEVREKAVVLLSGGLDSTTMLYYLVRRLRHTAVFALSFNYGQRHARELECAAWHARELGATEHRTLDIAFLGDLVKEGTSLIDGGRDIPDLVDVPPEARDQPPTYVPNRNMMLLAMAAAYGEAKGAHDVYYGAQAQDAYGYWDCTHAFLSRINDVLALNRRQPVRVHAPFLEMRKSSILRLGLELGVDFSRTWSCYRGGTLACGTCPTCVERLRAFRALEVHDPLHYQQAL